MIERLRDWGVLEIGEIGRWRDWEDWRDLRDWRDLGRWRGFGRLGDSEIWEIRDWEIGELGE